MEIHATEIHRTRWSKGFALLLAVVLAAALGACDDSAKRAEERAGMEARQAADETTAADTDTGDGGEVTARTAFDDVTTGHELAADGAIAPEAGDDQFTPGETVYVAMRVGEASPGSSVELVWYGPDGMEAGSDSKQVEADASYLDFAVDTTGWAEGDYRGEIWYDNELVQELAIDLAAAGDAS